MIRFYNGKVLTFTGDMELTEQEVWTDGAKISYVGAPRSDAPIFEREIDLKGNLLLPGFKNAHAHTAMTFLRSFADDLPLQSWLFDKVFPYEAKLTPEDIYILTKLGIMEYLAGGITSAFDMYFHREAFAQAAIDTGYRMVICGGLTAGDDISIAENDIEKLNHLHPLISYLPGIHAEFTANPDLLKQMKTVVDASRLPFFSHNSETKKEYEECKERHGLSPTALFEEYGLYEYGGGGFHCVWFDEKDIDIYARRGLYAVTCPESNAKLASGIAPVCEFLRRGVPLAIGTDGAASNNALNMFRAMYLASVLQKLRENDAAACDAKEILRAACSTGARAMRLDADAVAEGKLADLVVIDLHRANMQPVHNTVKNLVYSGSNTNVLLTMVNGRVLYENGVYHIGESPEEIFERAQKVTDRITKE